MTVMKKYLLLYLLPLFLYGCTDSVDELDGKGDIYGVVVESTTANPVRAAGVSLYIQDETMPSLLLKTVTYDDGHFEFNKIKDKDKTFREKLNLINKLIENVYKDSFRLYPYDAFVNKYRKYF